MLSIRRLLTVFIVVTGLLFSALSAASGVVLGSYLNASNAEKAAVAARSVLRDLGKTNQVRVISGKASTSRQLSRVVILSADEREARTLLGDLRFSYPDAWFLVDVPAERLTEQGTIPAIHDRQETSFERALQDQKKKESESLTAGVRPKLTMPRTGSAPQTVIGQEAGVDLHRVPIETLDESEFSVVIDGKVNEEVWGSLPYYDNMLVSVPALLTQPEYGTEIRMFATKKGCTSVALWNSRPNCWSNVIRKGMTFSIEIRLVSR